MHTEIPDKFLISQKKYRLIIKRTLLLPPEQCLGFFLTSIGNLSMKSVFLILLIEKKIKKRISYSPIIFIKARLFRLPSNS